MSQENIKKPVEDQQQSEWSLSSLEELKGLDLNELKEDQEGNQMQKEMPSHVEPKTKLQPKFPPPQSITPDTKLHEVGKILQKVGDLLIIEANSPINLVDLDNWLFDQKKECIGFVIDIFGKVDHPYYAVRLSEKMEKEAIDWAGTVGISMYYAQGCKTLTEEDIRSIKEKSSVNKEVEQDSSDSSEESNNQEDIRSNVVMKKRERSPRRRASFEEQPYHQRERTREKKPRRRFEMEDERRRHHDTRRPFEINRDRQHNQAYLESMYNSYYTQMMQLYNGQNGMPLPKPPVFPFFQQAQMPPMPNTQIFPPMQNSPFTMPNPPFLHYPPPPQ